MIRVAALSVIFSSLACAGYIVSIDTNSVAGVSGGIYLQFNPGPNSDPIQLTIDAVSTDGLIGSTILTNGNTSGSLGVPPLQMDNLAGLNDYYNDLTFGTFLQFRATFLLPASFTGTSGSTFGFGLTASDGITPLLTNDPSGFAGQISIDSAGQFALTAFPDANGGNPVSTVSFIPEPASYWLVGAGLIVATAGRRFRRRLD